MKKTVKKAKKSPAKPVKRARAKKVSPPCQRLLPSHAVPTKDGFTLIAKFKLSRENELKFGCEMVGYTEDYSVFTYCWK